LKIKEEFHDKQLLKGVWLTWKEVREVVRGPSDLVLPKSISGRLVQGITRTTKKERFRMYFNEDLDVKVKERQGWQRVISIQMYREAARMLKNRDERDGGDSLERFEHYLWQTFER